MSIEYNSVNKKLTIKPASIIVIIWATLVLFSDLTVLYSEWSLGIKACALVALLYAMSLEHPAPGGEREVRK